MSSVVRLYLVIKLSTLHLNVFCEIFKIYLKLHPAGCLPAKQNGEVQGGVHLMKITRFVIENSSVMNSNAIYVNEKI